MNQTQPKFPNRYQNPENNDDFLLNFLGNVFGSKKPDRQQVDRYGSFLWKGDPLADALIIEWQKMPSGAGFRQLQKALDHGLDSLSASDKNEKASAALINLFQEIETVPIWFQPQSIKAGIGLSHRSGFLGDYVLSCVSLQGGYRSGAANKPIAFTGALDYNAARRLAETSKFVFDCTRENGMDRNGAGFKSAVKVRMMHAQVRFMLSRSDRWQPNEWGLPINQADLIGTNLLFSVVFLAGLRLLGLQISKAEAQGMIDLWRYIGYVMGVDQELLPATEYEGLRLAWLIGLTQPPADNDSLLLGQALHQIPMQRANTTFEKSLAFIDMHLRAGLTRLVLGDKAGEDLGLPNTPAKFAVLAVAPTVFAFETLRRITPGATFLSQKIGDAIQKAKVDSWLAHKPAQFQPPQELKREASYG